MTKYILQYDKPAQISNHGWQREVLPIGSGALGMCIYGGVEKDILQFNEKTLWQGGPSDKRPNYNGGNIAGSYEVLKQMQKALEDGNETKVLTLKDKLIGLEDGYGNYLNFGDLIIENDYSSLGGGDKFENYHRNLNIEDSIATTQFDLKGNKFTRKYFASFPNKVIVVRYDVASKNQENNNLINSKISFNIARESQLSVEEKSIIAKGIVDDNGLNYYAKATVNTDGKIAKDGIKIAVNGATYMEVWLSAGTDYAPIYPKYRGESPIARVDGYIREAVATGYEKVLAKHIADYKALFDRVKLDLVGGKDYSCKLMTDDLLRKYNPNGTDLDSKYLEELLFNYGRYLIISSSRPGDLPANLQGVWNNSNTPQWGCDYHLNVNLQMCYWHVFNSNLPELALPLLDYMETLRVAGRVTAKEYHNIESTRENPNNGWVCHTQCTPFGWTCPGWDFYWGWSPAASTWMMQNCFDYYEFTEDKEVLANKIYPMMRENAKFWIQNLVYNKSQDRWVSSPSFSPEHGPISVGNTYEQEMIYILFRDTIKAGKIVGGDDEFLSQLEKVLPKLNPLGVGKLGQIKEWYEEDEWIKVKLFKRLAYKSHRCENKHRHASHLIGLYPAIHITRETSELLNAAKVSLTERGLGGIGNDSGWGKANKINMWARAKEGDEAYRLVVSLIKGNIAKNLWDLHPPFQMDGNCGFTAGVIEMLVYSCDNYIELLPALPTAWANGKISGVCARGNYTVSLKWENGKVVEYTIDSKTKTVANVMVQGKISKVKTGELIKLR